ncbi:MAG: SAM-dependent chlorinase/fluorinase, partial [Candidatus Omnitrophica bacterium]|nr:SAM-dependent chlorinase/fluorinase [Candidatus Omnitrophota bacterium]
KKDVFRSFGPMVPSSKVHRFLIPSPTSSRNSVQGQIIYIDHFGNAMTNIAKHHFQRARSAQPQIIVKEKIKIGLKPFFSAGRAVELFAVWNSNDRLELAAKEDSAEKRYRLKVGDSVVLSFPLSRQSVKRRTAARPSGTVRSERRG